MYLNAALDEARDDPAFITQVLGGIARLVALSAGHARPAWLADGCTRRSRPMESASVDPAPLVLRALAMKVHAEPACHE